MKLAEPLNVGGVTIEEIDIRALSDDDVVVLNAFGNIIREEIHPEDPPRPVELTRSSVDNIPDFIVTRDFWARDADGSVVATGDAIVTRTEDNQHVCRTEITVRADHRRRGIGKALLRLVVDVATAEDRRLLVSWTNDRIPAGGAFAQRVGAEVGLAMHTNRLLLADVDRDLVGRWIDEGPGRAPEYSVIAVDGRYPTRQPGHGGSGHDRRTGPRDGEGLDGVGYRTVGILRAPRAVGPPRRMDRGVVEPEGPEDGESVGDGRPAGAPRSRPRKVAQGRDDPAHLRRAP
jgi:GNAT superfamily N-acetyltransferase